MPGDPSVPACRDRMSGAGDGELYQTLSRLEQRFRSTGLRAPRDYPVLRDDPAGAMSRVLVVRPS
eukprot:3825553-Prymnesium_polylepis.1